MGEEDYMQMDPNNQPGFDQEQLTQEEKDEVITKSLSFNDPQAPSNITQFSWKDRCFKKDETGDAIIFHFSFDGDIIIKDSEEARDQEQFWEDKKRAE